MTTFEIRTSDAGDVAGLKGLVPLLKGPPDVARYGELWFEMFPLEGDRGVIALDDGRLVGASWFGVRGEGNVPELVMAVQPSHQGSGLGRALVAASVGPNR